MKFLNGLSEDLKINLLSELKTLWTHTSTAIEGNTLSLGETHFVISEGLTISGKSLKDHRDIEGHAKAVDVIFELVKKEVITKDDLFNLHKLIINKAELNVYKPIGEYKNDPNSTSMVVNGLIVTIDYSRYYETAKLMDNWLTMLNDDIKNTKTFDEALRSYTKAHISFVSIHPFFDGNGRMARLLSNLPCLKAGFPPIIIQNEDKYAYKQALAKYQVNNGVPSLKTELVNYGTEFDDFMKLCKNGWKPSLEIIQNISDIQGKRNNELKQYPNIRRGR